MITKKEKQEMLEQIRSLWNESNGFVLVDSQLLTASHTEEFRRESRKAGLKLHVFKNTLFGIIAKEHGIDVKLEKFLAGPTAFMFGPEASAIAKFASEFSKKYPKLFKLKAGFTDGTVFDAEGVKVLATIPSRQDLLGMVAAAFNGPIVKFARVLEANISGFARVLNAVKEQKEKAA